MGDLVPIPTLANIDSVTLERILRVNLLKADDAGIEFRFEVDESAENKSFWLTWLGRLRFVMTDPCTPCRYDVWAVSDRTDGSFILQARLAVRLRSSDRRVPSSKENVNLLAGTCSREMSITRP